MAIIRRLMEEDISGRTRLLVVAVHERRQTRGRGRSRGHQDMPKEGRQRDRRVSVLRRDNDGASESGEAGFSSSVSDNEPVEDDT